MKVCFPTPDLTSLRYFVPIIELIKDSKNIEVLIYFRRDCVKYNCLKNEKNYNIFKKITSSLNPAKIIPMTNSKIKCDVLFTIENVDRHKFHYKKHYAIQHGFDYQNLGIHSDSKTIYLCHSDLYGLDLFSKYNTKYLTPPLPVAFSNLNDQIKYARKMVTTNKEIAFIFYPYKGYVSLTRSIVKDLKKKDYFIIVKQRRKWQEISKKIGADLILYDDIWYPSESIFYPLISKFAIGFGTSSYTDLCEVGMNYIDIPVEKGFKKGRRFTIKPNLKNYWYVDKRIRKNTNIIIDQISLNNYTIKNINIDLIKKFYLDLLKI